MFKDPIDIFVLGSSDPDKELTRICAILVEAGIPFVTKCFCQFTSKNKYQSCKTTHFTPSACTNGTFITTEKKYAKFIVKTIKQVRKDISTDK